MSDGVRSIYVDAHKSALRRAKLRGLVTLCLPWLAAAAVVALAWWLVGVVIAAMG